MKETNTNKITKSIVSSLGNLVYLTKKINFYFPLMIFTIAAIPVFGFVGGASNIIIAGFAETPQIFGFYFGMNASFSILGPILFIILTKRYKNYSVVSLSFIIMLISGILIIYVGQINALIFTFMVIPGTIANGILRPAGMNIMLEQGKEYPGAAASLASFFVMLVATLGTFFISIDWDNRVTMLGMMSIIAGSSSLVLWFIMNKKEVIPFI